MAVGVDPDADLGHAVARWDDLLSERKRGGNGRRRNRIGRPVLIPGLIAEGPAIVFGAAGHVIGEDQPERIQEQGSDGQRRSDDGQADP